MSSLDTVAPIKEISLKNRTKPWTTAEILYLIKTRDEFLYKFKKHNLQEDYKKYCKMRNKVLREISITKADFFSNKVEENKFDSKKLWQQLKSLGYKNKQNESSKIVLKIDNAMCHDPKRIAESFNNFFYKYSF